MRIGEFAQKHGITQDTIRHYLDMGLLVTEKKGGQYKFSEADSKDIEKIIELKQLDFSLTEIQKVLAFQRLSGSNSDVFRNLYRAFLEEKQYSVSKELAKYNKMNDFLKYKIHEINSEELKNKQVLGFPITSLRILACPVCHQTLNMSDGTIEKNMIMDANIQCECGYSTIIKDGIYIDETAVRTKMQNGKKMPTKEEYLEYCSHAYVNFLYKGMTSLIEFINKYEKEPQYIMELDNCVGFFLLQYIKYLPKSSTYVLIDFDLERIIQLKKNLEMYYEHKNFIFLCCDYHRLPIANLSVDVMIDHGMTNEYANSTGQFLPEQVLPMLKQDGLYTASFHYNEQKIKTSLNLIKEKEEYFDKGKMLDKLAASHLLAVDEASIGPVSEDNHHNPEDKIRDRYQAVYAGRKRAINGVRAKVLSISTK